MSRAVVSAVVAIAAVAAAVSGVRFAEQWFLFPAPPVPAEAPPAAGNLERAWVESAGSRAEAFLLLPGPSRTRPVPLIVYAHGNGELIDHWLPRFKQLTASGAAVLLVEYPGYGRSPGVPSEASIQRALAAGYDWATSRPDIDAHRVIGYGASLGGGAICALGRIRPFAALVLESTFTSFPDLLAERPAPIAMLRYLVRNEFDNLVFVRTYEAPMLVLHGDRDAMIPLAHSQRLARAGRRSELKVQSCGHNDCPASWPTLLAFLNSRGLLRERPPS